MCVVVSEACLSLVLFVCCQAARVFIGSKQRLKVNVPSLQTPSARRAAHGAVLYKWTKAEATKAFEAHLQMAKDLATGERITDRQVGSEITAESRQNRARIRQQDEKRTRARGRASSHKPKKKKKKKSKTPRSSSSSSSSQSMQLEQPELDDEDSAAASPPKKKSRTEGVSFRKTSGGRVSKPYQHRGDLYYNYR